MKYQTSAGERIFGKGRINWHIIKYMLAKSGKFDLISIKKSGQVTSMSIQTKITWFLNVSERLSGSCWNATSKLVVEYWQYQNNEKLYWILIAGRWKFTVVKKSVLQSFLESLNDNAIPRQENLVYLYEAIFSFLTFQWYFDFSKVLRLVLIDFYVV